MACVLGSPQTAVPICTGVVPVLLSQTAIDLSTELVSVKVTGETDADAVPLTGWPETGSAVHATVAVLEATAGGAPRPVHE